MNAIITIIEIETVRTLQQDIQFKDVGSQLKRKPRLIRCRQENEENKRPIQRKTKSIIINLAY